MITAAKVGFLKHEFKGLKEGPHYDLGISSSIRLATENLGVNVLDARDEPELHPSLDTTGFVLLRHETKCQDFRNKDLIQEVYYPEMIDLVKRHTGAEQVVVTVDSIVRTEEEGWGYKLEAGKPESGYAPVAHLDFNDGFTRQSASHFSKYAHRRLEKGGLPRAPGEDDASFAQRLSPERFEEEYDIVAYNLWQPIEREVLQHPLVLLDARTVDEDADLWPGGQKDTNPIGGDIYLSHNPNHRWYYFSKMCPDEILLFMGHKLPRDKNSPNIPGSGKHSPHVSVWDPGAPSDAPERRSVETRVLAAFPKKRGTTAAKL